MILKNEASFRLFDVSYYELKHALEKLERFLLMLEGNNPFFDKTPKQGEVQEIKMQVRAK